MHQPVEHFQISREKKDFFEANGYVVIEDIIDHQELERLRTIYDKFLNNEFDLTGKRSDLGGHLDKKQSNIENITQIMWPTDILPELQHFQFMKRG